MKKVLFKLTEEKVNGFLDVVISANAKPLLSYSKEDFLSVSIYVWVLCDDEQLKAFEPAFKPVKTV